MRQLSLAGALFLLALPALAQVEPELDPENGGDQRLVPVAGYGGRDEAAFERLGKLAASKDEDRDLKLVHYTRAFLEIYPHSDRKGAVLYLLGTALARLDRNGEALPVLQTVVKEHPRHKNAADAEFLAGEILLESGEIDLALAAFEHSLEAWERRPDPAPARCLLRIGRIHAWKRDKARALASFQRSMRGWPDAAPTKRIEKHELPALELLGKQAPKAPPLAAGSGAKLNPKARVVVFWDSSLDPTGRFAGGLRELAKELPQGTQVHGVLCEAGNMTDAMALDKALGFLQKADMPFGSTVEWGGLQSPLAVKWGVTRLPSTYVVSAEGKILVAGAPPQVLRKLLGK